MTSCPKHTPVGVDRTIILIIFIVLLMPGMALAATKDTPASTDTTALERLTSPGPDLSTAPNPDTVIPSEKEPGISSDFTGGHGDPRLKRNSPLSVLARDYLSRPTQATYVRKDLISIVGRDLSVWVRSRKESTKRGTNFDFVTLKIPRFGLPEDVPSLAEHQKNVVASYTASKVGPLKKLFAAGGVELTEDNLDLYLKSSFIHKLHYRPISMIKDDLVVLANELEKYGYHLGLNPSRFQENGKKMFYIDHVKRIFFIGPHFLKFFGERFVDGELDSTFQMVKTFAPLKDAGIFPSWLELQITQSQGETTSMPLDKIARLTNHEGIPFTHLRLTTQDTHDKQFTEYPTAVRRIMDGLESVQHLIILRQQIGDILQQRAEGKITLDEELGRFGQQAQNIITARIKTILYRISNNFLTVKKSIVGSAADLSCILAQPDRLKHNNIFFSTLFDNGQKYTFRISKLENITKLSTDAVVEQLQAALHYLTELLTALDQVTLVDDLITLTEDTNKAETLRLINKHVADFKKARDLPFTFPQQKTFAQLTTLINDVVTRVFPRDRREYYGKFDEFSERYGFDNRRSRTIEDCRTSITALVEYALRDAGKVL